MENEEDEIEKKHHMLLEKFLSKGDINSFRKMLNIETNPKPQKSKGINLIRSVKTNPGYLYRKFHNDQNYVKTEDYSPLNVYSGYSKYENYSLDRKSPFKDPDYKDKCLKGNYKSYSMKFDTMKKNWAKRRGISYEHFQVPKIETYKKNQNKLLDGNSLGIISNEFENNYEDEIIRKNNEIMSNNMDNIKYSQSLKLPRIHSFNPNRNNNNNNNFNYSNMNVNKF